MKGVESFQLFLDYADDWVDPQCEGLVSGHLVLVLRKEMVLSAIYLVVSDEFGTIMDEGTDTIKQDNQPVVRNHHHRIQMLGKSGTAYPKGQYNFPFNFRMDPSDGLRGAYSICAYIKNEQGQTKQAHIVHATFCQQDYLEINDNMVTRQVTQMTQNVIGQKRETTIKADVVDLGGDCICFRIFYLNNSLSDLGAISAKLFLLTENCQKHGIEPVAITMKPWPMYGPNVQRKRLLKWESGPIMIPKVAFNSSELVLRIKTSKGKQIVMPVPHTTKEKAH